MTTQPERRADAYQASIEALRTEVTALRVEVASLKQINKEVAELRALYDTHDKILVRGNGIPSLQELYRGLVKTVNDHIVSQDEKQKATAAEWNKLKWLFIAAFIGQAMILLFAK